MNGVERGSMGAHVRARRACNGPTHLIPSVRTFTRTHALGARGPPVRESIACTWRGIEWPRCPGEDLGTQIGVSQHQRRHRQQPPMPIMFLRGCLS
jgi:hypothetical protein